MSWRDTATAIAQRAPGNFIGVALYGSPGKEPFWSVAALASAAALQDWYEEIAPSHPLFYYLAAFDKTQGTEPAGEAIAPIKPGMPGADMDATGRWRPPPYKAARVSGAYGGAALTDQLRRTPGLVSHGVVLQNPGAPWGAQIWAYEVRWLRGQPVPSLPPTINGHVVKLVIVDDYPRPQATVSGEDRSPASLAKTIGLFALFAIPIGIILTNVQEKKQIREEKAAFRRIGLDWDKRVTS